jgi:CRISPR/Cas system CMR subunit Cmr6 (Cas7 group RAMP superfamily)
MVQKRLTSAENIEGINEKERIFVPGLTMFDGDGLNDWLESPNARNINLSLLFHKYPIWFKGLDQRRQLNGVSLSHAFEVPKKSRAGTAAPRGRGAVKKEERHYKKQFLDVLVKLASRPMEHYEEIKTRYFFAEKYSFLLETRTRLLVGFAGTGTVFENSITLHPFYGFPVIPGSSIKGLVRSYCDFKKIEPAKILRMFGNEPEAKDGKEGEVIFLDAWPGKWPTGNSLLELDIMTPHYGKYYSGKGLPSDADSPNPICFMAVPRGVTFKFCILPSRTCRDEKILADVKDHLISALKTFGIGAKTGSSYGYFK